MFNTIKVLLLTRLWIIVPAFETKKLSQVKIYYPTLTLKACQIWYPRTLTQAGLRLFSRDNVSSPSHVEINTRTWVLALSICSARLNLVSQRCRAGPKGNNFPIIEVITPHSYHRGCLSKKSCICGVIARAMMVLSLGRMKTELICRLNYISTSLLILKAAANLIKSSLWSRKVIMREVMQCK